MTLAAVCAAAVLVFYLAAVAQAVTGFGSALVAVPLLTLLVDPVTAVVATTSTGLVLTALAAFRERRHVAAAPAVRLTVAGLLGLPVGLLALVWLEPRSLTLLIAGTIGCVVVLLWLRVPVPSGRVTQWPAGVVSGAMLTSTGMNGPPLVLTLQALRLPPRQFRGTLQTVFFGQDLLAVVAFLALGHVDLQTTALVLAGAAGIPLGWRTGDRLFARIPAERFRVLVLSALLVTAAVSAVTALS